MDKKKAAPRLIIVSNRLPVTVKVATGGDASANADVQVIASSGGLATGLRGHHEKSDGMWVGWPGETDEMTDAQKAKLEDGLQKLRCVPVHLSKNDIEHFYDGFSNGILWPLFHYLLDRIPHDSSDWESYREVNERFADAVAKVARPDDLIWVQDYQLCLLPELLRQRLPEAKIGFFLHIPFPSNEVFRTLPWRAEILRGLLGADLIGFHTFGYLRHFTSSLLRILGVETQVDRAMFERREARFGVYPMGIDAAAFRDLAHDAKVEAEVAQIAAGPCAEEVGSEHPSNPPPGMRLLLGVDRLDYTKGLPRRLLAFERLLQRNPELHGHVRLVQVAVPSRTNVKEYASYRSEVDELVGRINGKFGTVSWTPVHYLYRSIAQTDLVALYRAANVMLVTPLRDGMNLVAKEFVAAREDEDGVLVLSELAGAAAEMGEAILVNPYDVEGMATAIKDALDMPQDERKERMRSLRKRVIDFDVHWWAASFLEDLQAPRAEIAEVKPARRKSDLVNDLAKQSAGAPELRLLLDYDGTLVPFARTPELARPDAELLNLLTALSKRSCTRVSVISGRPRESLAAWLGHLDIGLYAEHGFWSRPDPKGEWTAAVETDAEWKQKARMIFDSFTARTPGSRVEEKTASLAWHYRNAEPEFGALQAKDLRAHLSNVFSNAPVEVIVGEKVVELRPYGVNKGVAVKVALAGALDGVCILAMGDDDTDEDMFAALPETALSAHVGPKMSRAAYRLETWQAARDVLRTLL